MATSKQDSKKQAPRMYTLSDKAKEQIRMGDVDSLESPDILKTEMGNKPDKLLTGKLMAKGPAPDKQPKRDRK